MKIALYPGSFDPITNGHIDIIHRACKIFDKVIIAVAHNPAKKTLFTVKEREDLIKSIFKDKQNISVESFSGLATTYARKKKINVVIRGLRVVTDFDYELSLALMNQKLNKDLETVFFMTNEKLSFVSSTLIKEVAQFGGQVKEYVPPAVARKLAQKFKIKGVRS